MAPADRSATGSGSPRAGPPLHDLPSLRGRVGVFADRSEAGRVLAGMLGEVGGGALVLGLAAGGLPVAAELASRLGLPLLPAVVSKITLPWDTESGYGAVAFDGGVLLNQALLATLPLTPGDVEEGIARTRRKVTRRTARLGGVRTGEELSGRRVILVDDGLASGFTMLAAIRALRRAGVLDVTVAVPTAHASAAERVAAEADRVICANLRSGPVFAVADAYRDWHDVTEKEALEALASAPRKGVG